MRLLYILIFIRSLEPSLEPTMQSLRVTILDDRAKLPVRASAGAAGYDLASVEDASVPARGRKLIKTGLKIAVPDGTYGRIAPRSSLALKHFVDVGAGVIDADYRGEVGVVLFNHADEDFIVKHGDRVAQLVLERIVTPDVFAVDSVEETDRGAGGFGSTGLA